MWLSILLLCGILSQGVIGTFADGNNRESSDILFRQKRVINRMQGGDVRAVISAVPYIVMIRYNTRISCAGSILSYHVVITTCQCVLYQNELFNYHVVSRSARSDHGTVHNVTDIKRHFVYQSTISMDGVALLIVEPPFEFGPFSDKIELHTGPLLPGTIATVSGWGYNCGYVDAGTLFPKNLRSIKVPIVSHRDCVNRYRPHNIVISDKEICTFHPQKHCGHNDGGAPLVIDGELVGVHLWTGPRKNQIDPDYPDVFAVLQVSEYSQWIRTNVQRIETYLRGNNHY